MVFDAFIVDPLAEPVPREWSALVRQIGLPVGWDPDVLRSFGWYGTHPPLMAVVTSDDGKPCALFCVRHVGLSVRRRFFAPQRPLRAGFLECHLPPFITTPGYAFHPDTGVAERAAAVSALELALARRLGWRHAGVLYRQVGAADLPVFRAPGRLVRRVQPDAVLDNRWDSIEAYLADRPRRDRKNLRRMSRLVGTDPAVRAGVETSLNGADASRLLYLVQLRHQRRFRTPTLFPPLYHDLMAGRPGVHYFTYRDRVDQLLAYGLLLDDGSTLRCQGWGALDPADGGRPNLYFDHFFRQIAYLIEHGRERIVMGKGNLEVKARFGARAVPLYAVASARRAG